MGKFQVLAKFGTATYDYALGDDVDQDTLEFDLNYIIKSFNARISLYYLDKSFDPIEGDGYLDRSVSACKSKCEDDPDDNNSNTRDASRCSARHTALVAATAAQARPTPSRWACCTRCPAPWPSPRPR